jgi:hypothetical protein
MNAQGTPTPLAARHARGSCVRCAAPVDSIFFDEASIAPAPPVGQTLVLARVEIAPRYCGVLECFSQFTDRFAVDPSAITTPELRWSLLLNASPLAPYQSLTHILNPWGYGSFRIAIPLRERSRLEFVVRGLEAPGQPRVASVG